MSFVDNYRAALAANDRDAIEHLEATAWDWAYMDACEQISPNAPDFDELHESHWVSRRLVSLRTANITYPRIERR